MTFSWTQPLCETCWRAMYPGRTPSKLLQPELEVCCNCGSNTTDGIYIRVNPNDTQHPTRLKE